MSVTSGGQSSTDFSSISPDPVRRFAKESGTEKLFRIIALIAILLFPVVLVICVRVVKQYKRAVILRFGKVRKDSPAGPGIIWVIPCTDDVQMIDLRTQSFNLPPQEVLTKDSVTVTVDAVVYFHIERPLVCLLNIQNNKYATELITIATIRNIIGGHSLYNLLTSRESISFKCRTAIDKTTTRWGVVIERVEIKDVFLPFELQKAMAAEAEGTRIAKAKVIEAEGEIKAAENLKEASKIMLENPHVMQLRYLQTLNYMAADQHATVIFPVPIETPGSLLVLEPAVNVLTLRLSDQVRVIQRNNILDDAVLDRLRSELQSSHVIVPTLQTVMVPPRLATSQADEENDDRATNVVRQFERAVILRNGKLRSGVPYGPGLVQYLPCVDTVKFTDLRIICYAVPPQEALTKDALTVAVDAVVYYKIYDPIWAVVNIADYKIATQFLAATTLRNALGTRKLSDILCDRPAVSFQVFGNMKNLTLNWGVKIVGFEVKDISLPLQLQRAMATEAESYRLANAKIIVAKAEIESAKNLQKATELLMDNPYCMQLRYLQALQMIAGDKTHTIVMPFSAESLKKLLK